MGAANMPCQGIPTECNPCACTLDHASISPIAHVSLHDAVCSALVATLAGMFLANVGILPPGAHELEVVYKFMLPLAIPLLLFSADLR